MVTNLGIKTNLLEKTNIWPLLLLMVENKAFGTLTGIDKRPSLNRLVIHARGKHFPTTPYFKETIYLSEKNRVKTFSSVLVFLYLKPSWVWTSKQIAAKSFGLCSIRANPIGLQFDARHNGFSLQNLCKDLTVWYTGGSNRITVFFWVLKFALMQRTWECILLAHIWHERKTLFKINASCNRCFYAVWLAGVQQSTRGNL